jgi:hypothetical protein
VTRSDFLAALIGQPWSWQNGNCWDFAVMIQRELFGRDLPSVAVPRELSKRWVLEAFDCHQERANWSEVSEGPGGLVVAQDGALCLMAHLRIPGHIGVWMKPEGKIIHCDERAGVCFEAPLALRQQGWRKLRFFEPK